MDDQSENNTPETTDTDVDAVTDENLTADDAAAEPAADAVADTDLNDADATDSPVADDAVDAAAAQPASRFARARRPLWVGIAAGVAGLALGIGGAALVGGHDGHGGRDGRGGHHQDGGGHHDGGADHVDIDGDGN